MFWTCYFSIKYLESEIQYQMTDSDVLQEGKLLERVLKSAPASGYTEEDYPFSQVSNYPLSQINNYSWTITITIQIGRKWRRKQLSRSVI